jgi:hypothetical protein
LTQGSQSLALGLVLPLLRSWLKDQLPENGLVLEGARRRLDVMLKDSRRFAATGGWGFERFSGDSETERPLTETQRAQCFSCHGKRNAQDFVFSKYRK